MNITKATTLAGFLELEPKKQIVFNEIKNKIEQIFILNGLTPMDTPVLEQSKVLLVKAGGETEKQIYRFNKGNNDICLRFDLTVPFAKYVSIHQNELIFPFRRYQIGKVFRGERTQKGRFREFYQCDVDIINDDSLSLLTDAECINILSQIYQALGIEVVIKISNRKILNGAFEYFDLVNESDNIYNILDKKDKIDQNSFLRKLKDIIKDDEKIKQITQIANTKTINEMKSFDINNKTFQNGIQELEELFCFLDKLNLHNEFVLDIGIIRGLDYYTSTVFEASLKDFDNKISVGGGGRYENLTKYYSEKDFCGVGFSVGLTRLFDILDRNNELMFDRTTTSKVAIIPFEDTISHCFAIKEILCKNSIPCEVLYFNKPFKNKMHYVDKKNIPYLMVIGETEIKNNIYGIKDMKTGRTFEGDLQEILNFLGRK